MKTVGIIGGLGPESTIEYYRLMLAAWRERKPDGSAPSMIINSVDMNEMVKLTEAGQYTLLAGRLAQEIDRLQKAGADFGLLSANTPHIVFDEIQRQTTLPLLSIVATACDAAQAMGLKRLGLLGTRFTMQATFYQDVFSRAGITLIMPDPDQHPYIHDKYMNELVRGIFLPETRERLLGIAGRMRASHGIEGLILGGTELPLILRGAGDLGIPFLDTTQLHVNAAVERLLA